MTIRIYERVEVVAEDGEIVRVFTREMDPRHYVIIRPTPYMEWIQRTRKLTEAQAAEFEREADRDNAAQ